VSKVVLRDRSCGQLAAELAARPDEVVTFRADAITAGLLLRRRVRVAFNSARMRGAQVEVAEERGLLDSVFTVRLRGTGDQLLPALRQLAALEEEP
jgi:hypothetical protein